MNPSTDHTSPKKCMKCASNKNGPFWLIKKCQGHSNERADIHKCNNELALMTMSLLNRYETFQQDINAYLL